MLQVHGLAVIAADHAALYQVLQFTDIAGEVVGQQGVDQAAAEAGNVPLVPLAVALQEVVHQQRDVFPAFTQAGNLDGVYIEAVEQILAETPGAHFVAQLNVGGGYQPYVHANGFVAPDPFDLAFLQGAQDLALGVQAEGDDFVEEQGAAVGAFEAPRAAAVGTGEGAPFHAEEFGFDQAFRQGGAVEADQRAFVAAAVPVQVLREEFLADA